MEVLFNYNKWKLKGYYINNSLFYLKGVNFMITIRNGLFETNSSSVHVLVIPKDMSITIPKKVYLYGGEYGWSDSTEYNTLDYFYQACIDRGRDELDKFFNYLKRKGVEEIHSPEINWVKSEWNGREYEYAANNNGYIDHSEDIPLNEFFVNENLLDRFLFSNDAFVKTGNDNSEYCPSEDDYDDTIYDIITKGN